MDKLYLVYKITNLLNNHIYIGIHSTYNINDNYMGSSRYLTKDIKKFGKENFKKEILHIFEKIEDALNKEAELVTKEFCYRNDTYNRLQGGISGKLYTFWNDMILTKDLNGNVYCAYKDDPRIISGELISYTHSDCTKNKISNTLSNKTYEEIHGKNAELEKKKRSIGAKKQWSSLTKEEKDKISKKMSENTKGIPKNFKKITCPHCGKEGRSNVMHRWHFNNCKNK